MSCPIFSPPQLMMRFLRQSRQRQICQCSNPQPKSLRREKRVGSHNPARCISTAPTQLSEMEVSPEPEKPPRWSQTPPGMDRPPRPARKPWVLPLPVNTDPKLLDKMYTTFLGAGGDSLLSEETKWQAVTHKSFDWGRRGFNDRLAFFGKRILELQTSLALLATADSKSFFTKTVYPDGLQRQHFDHPATNMAEILIGRAREHFTHHKTLAELSVRYGLPEVVRWKPNDPDRLEASGSSLVYAQAMLAIVGALALEQGGEVATRITKERILTPLGAYAYKGHLDRAKVRPALSDQSSQPQ